MGDLEVEVECEEEVGDIGCFWGGGGDVCYCGGGGCGAGAVVVGLGFDVDYCQGWDLDVSFVAFESFGVMLTM